MSNKTVSTLYRYPVKGLTPELLDSASLTPGQCVPWDRAFALAQGDAVLDVADPHWIAKGNFMCLLRNAKIAKLHATFDEVTEMLHVAAPDGGKISAAPLTVEGRAELTAFLVAFLGEDARFHGARAPEFHYFPAHSFCDHKTQVVSLIGMGSLGALEEAVGAARDKRRFRANIYVGGLGPWEEFSWIGKRVAVGEAVLDIQERIDRCGATMVNPDTAERDANPVLELKRNFGHVDLGVFGEVVQAGVVRAGDAVRVIG